MRLVKVFLALLMLGLLATGIAGADGSAGETLVAQNTDEGAEKPCVPAQEDPWLTTPEEVLIEHPGFDNRRYGPVLLSHKDHNLEYGVACEVCHHFQQVQPPQQVCSECHFASGKVGKVPGLKTALHADCKGCHRAKQKAGESDIAPYLDCNACHQKAEKKE